MTKTNKSVEIRIQRVVIGDKKSAMRLKLAGSSAVRGPTYSKDLINMEVVADQVKLSGKGMRKTSPADLDRISLKPVTGFKKATFSAKGLRLSRSIDSLEIDVTDGVPMTSISIGEGKIGIGRSRKKSHFKIYKWSDLHVILAYGEQIFRELGYMKSGPVQLLQLSPKNVTVDFVSSKNQVVANAGSNRTHRLITLNGRERIMQINP